MIEFSYLFELKRLGGVPRKEAMRSSGDLEQMTEDLLRLLKRMFPNSEMYREHLENYVLQIIQGEVDA